MKTKLTLTALILTLALSGCSIPEDSETATTPAVTRTPDAKEQQLAPLSIEETVATATSYEDISASQKADYILRMAGDKALTYTPEEVQAFK